MSNLSIALTIFYREVVKDQGCPGNFFVTIDIYSDLSSDDSGIFDFEIALQFAFTRCLYDNTGECCVLVHLSVY